MWQASAGNRLTLKIERTVDGKHSVLRLSGRLSSEHLEGLTLAIKSNALSVALDLDEITQIDLDAVNFLRKCQSEGIELRHCSPYISEWMHREEDRERCGLKRSCNKQLSGE